MIRIGALSLIACLLVLPVDAAETARPADPAIRAALSRYVEKPDASFQWKQKSTGKLGSARYAELIMTSQTWRDIKWQHQLFVIKPSSAKQDNHHALLFITGGSWKPELADPEQPTQLPREANLLALLAETLQTPVGILLHVPQQPIFDGKREDQIISLTFENYLRTGESDWPLLLPMVKSTARAMDTVQQYAEKTWEMDIDTFTVTGASKRGWTTWLTGAVDKRATAIAPMVIDMLKMDEQMRHQKKSWGKVSYKIDDYSKRGLLEQLESPRGKDLRQIVDPWSYRDQLTQPKLIMIGTNDHYWPLDALNLYWKDLQGPSYILYVPNNRHGLKDLTRITGSLNALHQHAARNVPLPKLRWKFTNGNQQLSLRVQSDPAPEKVQAWVAHSTSRDFRESQWKAETLEAADGAYEYQVAQQTEGYTAVFAEAVYEGLKLPYYFSTNVQILEPGKPAASP